MNFEIGRIVPILSFKNRQNSTYMRRIVPIRKCFADKFFRRVDKRLTTIAKQAGVRRWLDTKPKTPKNKACTPTENREEFEEEK